VLKLTAESAPEAYLLVNDDSEVQDIGRMESSANLFLNRETDKEPTASLEKVMLIWGWRHSRRSHLKNDKEYPDCPATLFFN